MHRRSGTSRATRCSSARQAHRHQVRRPRRTAAVGAASSRCTASAVSRVSARRSRCCATGSSPPGATATATGRSSGATPSGGRSCGRPAPRPRRRCSPPRASRSRRPGGATSSRRSSRAGLMLLDGQEHLLHRRIMQEAFTRPRLEGYTEQFTKVIDDEMGAWPVNEPMLLNPAVKDLSLSVATVVFMGADPHHSDHLTTRVRRCRPGRHRHRPGAGAGRVVAAVEQGVGRAQGARGLLPGRDRRQACLGR